MAAQDIGSGIYTATQTKRVRQTYGIEGSHGDDVAKGIFCQPCSLIRNELEVRRRETENRGLQMSEGFGPPLPLGENDYRPLFAMANSEAYRPEPRMTSNGQQNREVHFHPPLQERGPQMVPPYPTGLNQLPPIPQIASPLYSHEGQDRRSHLLTPISERDSIEDPRVQHQRENIPNYPHVHTWLQSMSPSPKDKPTVEKAALVPGPGNPPALVPPCPGPSHKPLKKHGKKKGHKDGSPSKSIAAARCPECKDETDTPAAPEKEVLVQTNRDMPEIIITPGDQPRVRIAGSKPGRPHEITVDIVVPSPTEAQRQHSIQVDVRVPTPEAMPTPEHDLSDDERVGPPSLSDREHSISKDNRVAVDATPFRQHDIGSDEVVSDKNESEPEAQTHDLPDDELVAVTISPFEPHDIESDSRAPTPRALPAREHSISKDSRVATPVSRRPFTHGIRLDERVPTPELLRTNLEHDIFQDRRVLSPSPDYEEHDLHADERVKAPGLFPARQHSIKSDRQVAEPAGTTRGHGIQADDRVASPGPKRAKEHSLSVDTKVAQRAHQLLEQFLEQDKKSGSRTGSRAEKERAAAKPE